MSNNNQKELNLSGQDKYGWWWECNNCMKRHGNTVEFCDCGTRITCVQAGGHHDFDGDRLCDRGCGRKM